MQKHAVMTEIHTVHALLTDGMLEFCMQNVLAQFRHAQTSHEFYLEPILGSGHYLGILF